MIGVPMPDPREQITDHLNRALEEFFGAGGKALQIPAGVSGDPKLSSTPHHDRLRSQRDKLALKLKQLAEDGCSLNKAAESVGIGYKRARLIASENGFKFTS